MEKENTFQLPSSSVVNRRNRAHREHRYFLLFQPILIWIFLFSCFLPFRIHFHVIYQIILFQSGYFLGPFIFEMWAQYVWCGWIQKYWFKIVPCVWLCDVRVDEATNKWTLRPTCENVFDPNSKHIDIGRIKTWENEEEKKRFNTCFECIFIASKPNNRFDPVWWNECCTIWYKFGFYLPMKRMNRIWKWLCSIDRNSVNTRFSPVTIYHSKCNIHT